MYIYIGVYIHIDIPSDNKICISLILSLQKSKLFGYPL